MTLPGWRQRTLIRWCQREKLNAGAKAMDQQGSAEFASRAATGRPAQLRFAQPRYVTPRPRNGTGRPHPKRRPTADCASAEPETRRKSADRIQYRHSSAGLYPPRYLRKRRSAGALLPYRDRRARRALGRFDPFVLYFRDVRSCAFLPYQDRPGKAAKGRFCPSSRG
jgi:hypothetical protein